MNSMDNEDALSLFIKSDDKGPFLIGGKCKACEAVIFPRKTICPRCTGKDIEETHLSRKGKLYTYTEVHNKPPDYGGVTPYCIGRIKLPEGVFILSQLKANIKELNIDMDMELIVEPIYQDENGNAKLGFKFRPA